MMGLSREQLRDSVTYQAILREGYEEGLREGRQEAVQEFRMQFARNALLRAGSKRFGPMDVKTAEDFMAIDDVDTVCDLFCCLHDVNCWEELLQQQSDPFQTASV